MERVNNDQPNTQAATIIGRRLCVLLSKGDVQMPRRYLGLKDDELGPTRTQLVRLLTIHRSLVKVADLYGVLSTDVRSWCGIFAIQPPNKHSAGLRTRLYPTK